MNFTRAIIAFTLLVSAHPTSAADYRLFLEAGKAVPEYNSIIEALKPGDTVTFSDNKTFKITRPTQRGGLNAILPIEDNKALRVPIRSGISALRGEFALSIEQFLAGHEALSKYGVKLVKIYPEQSRLREYATVEWLDIQFLYYDYVEKKTSLGLTAAQDEKVIEDLIEFARSTWAFRNIGDLRPDQLAYTRNGGWVLFDFLAEQSFVWKVQHGTIFSVDHADVLRNQRALHDGMGMMSTFEKLPLPDGKGVYDRIIRAIESERDRRGMPHTLCARVLKKIESIFKQ